MPTDNTLDTLHQATIALCRDGSMKDRLAEAYADHLSQLDLEQIPADQRIAFDALRAAMNRALPLPRESMVRASVRKMSNEEASQHAVFVVRLYASVAREQRPARGRREAAARALRRTAHVSPVATPIMKLFAKES
jgi:hypothetical protein